MIRYRLEFQVYDSETDRYSPALKEEVELEVPSFGAHNEYNALCTMFHIIKGMLLKEGSTVLERRALAAVPTTELPPLKIDTGRSEMDDEARDIQLDQATI